MFCLWFYASPSWHLREIYNLHSVSQCVISQLIVKETSITQSQLRACKSNPYVSHMEQVSGPADETSGGMMSASVTSCKICRNFIFVVQNYRLLIKEILSCACWYLALLHWPFRATHYSHILKVDALNRLTVLQAGPANEQHSANYFLREQL